MDQNDLPAIKNLLSYLEVGSPELLKFVAQDIDLRIEHYGEMTGSSEQKASNVREGSKLLNELGTEAFPKGVKTLGLDFRFLGDGWYQTDYVQEFWCPLQKQDVVGRSLLISHETRGKVDFIRKIVASVEQA